MISQVLVFDCVVLSEEMPTFCEQIWGIDDCVMLPTFCELADVSTIVLCCLMSITPSSIPHIGLSQKVDIILRHAGLSLLDKHMTTGRINQVRHLPSRE